MTYRFLLAARNEFDAAIDWYEARSTTAAPKLIAAVYAVVRTICDMPQSGERWRDREDVRTFPIAELPYIVVYLIEPTEIVIVAIAHAKRRPGYWSRRLASR